MKRLIALAAVSALFLVGCGGGESDDTDPLAGGPAARNDPTPATPTTPATPPPPATRRGPR